MTRTKNKEASINDDFFIQGVIVALYKGIKKCVDNGINVIFVAGISTGIYSAPNPLYKIN